MIYIYYMKIIYLYNYIIAISYIKSSIKHKRKQKASDLSHCSNFLCPIIVVILIRIK